MKKILFFLAFNILYSVSFSQPKCGFDEKLKELLATNPEYARNYILTEQSIKNYIATHPPGITNSPTVAYTVPVVLHVMHTGGAIGSIYNPTDAQLTGFITYLNQVYAGTYPGMEAPVEGGGVVNLELQFALAQRTPSCGATNGIDRVNASSIPNYTAFGVNAAGSSGCTDLQLKNFARWNPADYYNIWIVNKIDGADGTSGQFIAGYAYFAGSPANVDGTVMLATQTVAPNKVLPHEIGHAFNLYHPFEGSNLNTQCPPNANCNTDGDQVCDTDPITNNVDGGGVYNFSCRTGTNTCPVPNVPYTKNTEHNFMSYTTCFTLFTNGQKVRTQAAMALPSRVSLSTSLGATPCGTVVNFVTASDAQTENNAGTTIDCRKYTDYSYQMSIGAPPSANAVVTLSRSGTATNGVDYTITTGNTLTFLSGTTTPQTFTVRVFDDAAAESPETVILNFSVAGGGASVGTTIPTFTLTINDNDAAPAAGGNFSNSVGAYNTNLGSTTPFRSNEAKFRLQNLWTASELIAAGITTARNFTSMTLRVVTKNSTVPYTGFTISMANTTATDLSTGFISPTFTTVYPATNYSTVVGDNLLTFSTPFAWDGTSNIVINFCFNNAAAEASSDVTEGTSNALGGSAATDYSSGLVASPCTGAAAFASAFRTRATFGTTIVGTPVSTSLISKIAYLGPNDDVPFYDASGNIMARIKNNTAFDYGCTTVEIDRAGTGTSPFWYAAADKQLTNKTLKVTPTNANPAGNYDITLYYSAAEKAGYETATGTSWSSGLQMVKSTGPISGITPGNPQTSTVTVNSVLTQGSLGPDYTVKATFTNGFSGFAVGKPGSPPLPISLLNFDGRKNGSVVDLNWRTAYEFNNRRFEIETSKDVANFYQIGTVNSLGNSTDIQSYSYRDYLPAKGVNYYRLKQVDMDGRSAYSRTIAVTFDGNGKFVTVFPNPAKDNLTVSFASPQQNVMLRIFSADGKQVRMESLENIQRSKEVIISNLNSGSYVLEIWMGNEKKTIKFIKE